MINLNTMHRNTVLRNTLKISTLDKTSRGVGGFSRACLQSFSNLEDSEVVLSNSNSEPDAESVKSFSGVDVGVIDDDINTDTYPDTDANADYIELELSPVHFVVKYEGTFYTNVEFVNEIWYVLHRLGLNSYIFEFYIFDNECEKFVKVLNCVVNIGIMCKIQALNLSNKFAKAVYRLNRYDKAKGVKLRVCPHPT